MGGFTKEHEESLELMDNFTILIVLLVSRVHTNVKAYQIVPLNMCSLLCASYYSFLRNF